MITRADLVFGREMGPSVVVSHGRLRGPVGLDADGDPVALRTVTVTVTNVGGSLARLYQPPACSSITDH